MIASSLHLSVRTESFSSKPESAYSLPPSTSSSPCHRLALVARLSSYLPEGPFA